MPKPLMITIIILCYFTGNLSAQQINAAYVKALYKQYPTQKSDLCAGCKLCVNSYYKSIADTTALHCRCKIILPDTFDKLMAPCQPDDQKDSM